MTHSAQHTPGVGGGVTRGNETSVPHMHFLLPSSPVPAETGPPIGSSVAGAMTSAEADSSQEEGEHQMEL